MSGLSGEFDGRVDGANVDATSPQGQAAIQELGFKSHGLVIRDATGAAVFKQPDHTVSIDAVRERLRELTK